MNDLATLRMFVDDAAGVALWSDEGPEELESFAISRELSSEIRNWVDEYTSRVLSGTRRSEQWLRDHDRRGRELALLLSSELRGAYEVKFLPNTKPLH